MAKKAISAENQLLSLAIKADAARRMPGRFDDAQLVVAEGDEVAVLKRVSDAWQGEQKVAMKEHAHLFCGLQIGRHLVGAHLGLKMIGVANKLCAEDMVEMAVGAKQMAQHEFVFGQIGRNGRFLFGEESAAVDDDGLAGLVAHDIAILLNEVDFEMLYVQHIFYLFFQHYVGLTNGPRQSRHDVSHLLCLKKFAVEILREIPHLATLLKGGHFVHEVAALQTDNAVG